MKHYKLYINIIKWVHGQSQDQFQDLQDLPQDQDPLQDHHQVQVQDLNQDHGQDLLQFHHVHLQHQNLKIKKI